MDVLWILVVMAFLTSVISGVLGMLGGMILMGVLLVFFDAVEAICIQGFIQFVANFQRYYQLRSHVNVKTLIRYGVGALIAFVVLNFISFKPKEIYIYAFMSLIAMMGAFRVKFPFDLKNMRVSFVSGLSVTAMQIGGVVGPVLDIVFQAKKYSRYEVIGTKAAMISMSHILKVLFMFQLIGIRELPKKIPIQIIFYSVLASILGTYAGKKILDKISDNTFYKATSAALFCLSVYYAISFWKLFTL